MNMEHRIECISTIRSYLTRSTKDGVLSGGDRDIVGPFLSSMARMVLGGKKLQKGSGCP
jgi:hypothetical protein